MPTCSFHDSDSTPSRNALGWAWRTVHWNHKNTINMMSCKPQARGETPNVSAGGEEGRQLSERGAERTARAPMMANMTTGLMLKLKLKSNDRMPEKLPWWFGVVWWGGGVMCLNS